MTSSCKRAVGLAIVTIAATFGLAKAGSSGQADPSIDWAFPAPAAQGAAPPTGAPPGGLTVPGSAVRLARPATTDLFRAVDWFPASHPPAPKVVMQGTPPHLMACGYCHMPDGQGRPENAAIAGLPAAYIVDEVHELKGPDRIGARPGWTPTALMHETAAAVGDADLQAAADYFSKLTYAKPFKVVETQDIPAVTSIGLAYAARAGGAREPLGQRIIEVVNDPDSFELRDNRPGYTAYVPQGSIARGKALAESGGGRSPPCSACHGAELKGDIGPPIAGRYPGYLFRQLLAFAGGGRRGEAAEPMRVIASQLSDAEKIDLAAYVASLEP